MLCLIPSLTFLSCLAIEESKIGVYYQEFPGSLMSGFDLELIGAQLQLFVYASALCMVLCSLLNTTVSMRLRPKRTFSGVVICYGSFHIKIFSNLFLFLRVDLT